MTVDQNQKSAAEQTPKLVWLAYEDDGALRGWVIECPCCGFGHLFAAKEYRWNKSFSLPTFDKLLRVEYGLTVCEIRVTNGRVYFTKRSTHNCRNMTLPLPEVMSHG